MVDLAKLMGHEETSTAEKYANATGELIIISRYESNTEMIYA